MLAVIKTGGKQYIVSPGSTIEIEKLPEEKEQEVIFDQALLIEKEDKVEIGAPTIEGATVKGKITDQAKGDKKVVFKFKSKKRHRTKKGHRQLYTAVEITNIQDK